ncbi:MAG: hypothetical protein RR632_05155 [Christensenella sp.]
MSNKKAVEYQKANIEGVEHLVYFTRYKEELTAEELMVNIEVDHFGGYEYCLAILLLAADEPVIARVRKRLFLKWFDEERKRGGNERTVNDVMQILREEQHNFEARKKRLEELDRQNKL